MIRRILFTAIILLNCLFAVYAGNEVEILNYRPGSYNGNIFIRINDELKKDIYYTFDDSAEKPDVLYDGGFLLSALSGEERYYNLRVLYEKREYIYSFLIDRKKPSVPDILLSQEPRSSAYGFTSLAEGDSVYYGFDDYGEEEPVKWTGENIYPPQGGFIFYYSEDEAGNRSDYGILTAGQAEFESHSKPLLDIKSPAAGEYANPQLLFINQTGYEWIKYTLNGTDPAEFGADYTGPVEIRRYGNVQLKIAAKSEFSEEITRREISYKVNTRAPLKNIPLNGFYSDAITIKNAFKGYHYCISDRPPADTDPVFNNELVINPIVGGIKYSVLRLRDYSDEQASEFRFFYIIDDRSPADPIISLSSDIPVNKDVSVKIRGPEYAEIFYTVDGTNPGMASISYKSPFTLRVPSGQNAGSLLIKARSISLNGKTSNVVSKFVTFDTKSPDKPEVSISRTDDGEFTVDIETGTGESVFYSLLDDRDVIPDTDDFSVLDNNILHLEVPEGMARDFHFVFIVRDDAGNTSEVSDVITVSIDRKPPETPVIRINDGILEASPAVNAEYSYVIKRNGKTVDSDSGEYTAPLDLISKLENGDYLELRVINSDSEGNSSCQSFSYNSRKTERKKEAYLLNGGDENIYSGSDVVFYAYPEGINDDLYYILTKKLPGSEPVTEGPFSTDGRISISGEENSEISCYLEVYSEDRLSGERSTVSSYNFIIDNKPPSVPQITGIRNGTLLNGQAILTPSFDPGSRAFITFSDKPETLKAVLENKSISFSQPLIFNVPSGTESDFYVQTGAVDAAGNASVNNELFYFRVDNKPPLISSLQLENLGNSYRIIPESEGAVKYFYEYGRASSIIRSPDFESESFTDELLLKFPQGIDQDYILKVAAADEAGNLSERSYTQIISIRDMTPLPASNPDIQIDRKWKKIFVSWKESDAAIHYSLSAEKVANETSYYTYDKPFSVKFGDDTSTIDLYYYTVSDSGLKSAIRNRTIVLPRSGNAQLAYGIENNGFYNSNQILKKEISNRILRYEITTDSITGKQVNVFSPVLTEELQFITEEGESIDFIVTLKEYENPDDITGGAEQTIRFQIDKQKPVPPEIYGVTDGEYYLSDCTASFSSPEGRIYYKVTSPGSSYEDKYREFTEPFDIVSKNGTYQGFEISAYSEDFAGNVSPVKTWNITIDKEIIYVSPDGRDYATGTRSQPFRTLEKAVEHTKKSGRKSIFLSEGSYTIKSSVIIDETVSITGGFRAGNWYEQSGRSILSIDNDFIENNPVFYIYGGNMSISKVDFRSRDKYFNALFYINKGGLSLNNSALDVECSDDSSLIIQNYGNVDILNSDISGKTSSAPYIINSYGKLKINKTQFDTGSLTSELTLFDSENAVDFNVSGSSFTLKDGKNSEAFVLRNSSIDFRNCSFNIKGSDVSGTFIRGIDSRIKISYSRMNGDIGNRITNGIITEDCRITAYDNIFSLEASSGIIGFNLVNGSSEIYNNTINTGESSDFSYLFINNLGEHSIENNIITVGTTDDMLVLRNKDGNIDFFNNTVDTGRAVSRQLVFEPEGSCVTRIINNIIIRKPGSGYNSLVLRNGRNMLSLKNNCFSGWDLYMDGAEQADNLIRLDLLDGIYSAGQFSENIEEDAAITFKPGSYSLSEESACIDNGYNLSEIMKHRRDFDGDPRPNPELNRTPAFDIGADEFYR